MGLLNDIGIKYQTDKCFRKHPTDPAQNFGHGYLDYYEMFFEAYRNRPIALIEIGVGGEEHPDRGGQSIRMWETYFPNGTIWGVDLYPKNMVRNFLQASQDDTDKLCTLPDADIIIDDASHVNRLSIATFGIMWPKLLPGGLYVLEDIHTSYFEGEAHAGLNYGGHKDPAATDTASAFLHQLSDQLQYDSLEEEFRMPLCHELEWIFRVRNTSIIKKKAL